MFRATLGIASRGHLISSDQVVLSFTSHSPNLHLQSIPAPFTLVMRASLTQTSDEETRDEYPLSSDEADVIESTTISDDATPSLQSPVSDASSSALPPAYTRDSGSISSIDLKNSMRVNFLHIQEKRESIKGVWTIDPTMRIPQGLLSSIKANNRMDNLNLYSWQQIQTVLTLASETLTGSNLVVESYYGMVLVDIVSRTNQRFHLNAASRDGPVTVYLPRDFEGPIAFRFASVQPHFSDGVTARMTLISRDTKQATAFIGDCSEFPEEMPDKNGKYENWKGDGLMISTRRCGAKICYSDEPREEDAETKQIEI
ncbi:hypothetical protein FRB97_004104 [Tulasnella sp. 331]|nr:hypothetical protein FRB97_004104 [Tulasnella sp. 331]